jgi:ankyrin repeat protein
MPTLICLLLLLLQYSTQTTAKVDKLGLALMLAVEQNKLSDVTKILDNGGNPSTVNRYSISILHTAVSQGNVDMVKILIDRNASINYPLDSRAGHRSGETPLHFAAADNQEDVATLLLHAGADPTLMTEGGMTALHLAAGLGNVQFIRQLYPFITEKEVVNMAGDNKYGSQPIHLAATSNHPETLKLLLELGASATTMNKRGSYPLHGAAMVGDVEAALLLINAGANKNALNAEGLTPLQIAEKRVLTTDDEVLIKNIAELRLLLSDADGGDGGNANDL